MTNSGSPEIKKVKEKKNEKDRIIRSGNHDNDMWFRKVRQQ
jgi:hypothetical protein